MHPQHMHMQRNRDKAQGPPWSNQPYKRREQWSDNELGAQFNLTKDHQEKKDHTCKHVLVPVMTFMCRAPYSFLIQRWKKELLSQLQTMIKQIQKGECPVQRPAVQHNDRQSETWKRPSVPLYLNELLTIKV